MSFAALQKAVTFLLSGLGLIALTFGGELTPVVMLAIGVAFVMCWFAERPLIEHPAWGRSWNVLVVVALGVQAMRGFSSGAGWLGLAMEFAALLSISRLANRRTAADYQQIAVLAFMHLIAATVLTTDLSYASVFVVFVVATPWVLTFAHLRAEIERNYPAKAEPHEGTDVQRVLSSKRIVAPSFLAWTAMLSIPMFAMTIALFFVFPRVGLGLVSFGGRNGQSVAGFGNTVELGGFGVIRTDPTVVLRVTSTRPLNAAQMHRYLRLRGTAFDHYDGERWTRSSDETVPMQGMGDYFPLRRVENPRRDLSLRIILDRLDEPVLFLPAGTVGVRIPQRGVPGRLRRTALTRGQGLDIRYHSSEELGIIYEAVVSRESDEMDVPVARDMDDGRFLQLPAGHERVYALARELTKDVAEPYGKALKLETYLRDGGRFVYTLNQPNTEGKAPLEAFLFEAKRGHCEYFATALAIMLRALDIPSRNVTGFVGGEYNPYANHYGIRQSDAHSWVEAMIPDRGWVTLDPTPPGRDAMGPGASLFDDLRKMVDAARAYWMTQVVSYDLRSQISALKRLRSFIGQLSFPKFSTGQKSPERAAKNESSPDLDFTAPAVVVVIGLLGTAAWLLLRRPRRQQRVLSASAKRARRLYRDLEQILADRGRARPVHVSPEAHARRLAAEGVAFAPAVVNLTELYVAARYGQRTLAQAELERMQGLVNEVKRAA
jgi:transglutaminase-like putative cysteine protease